MQRIRLRILLAVAVLGSCLPRAVAGGAAEPAVVLISLDGTPPEAVAGPGFETFRELRRRGTEAERLVPVLPSNTFPNHVSLVTGVAPEIHGIVNNVFLDRSRGLFSKSDDPTWIEVEPLWSLLGRHGIVSASYHWVGSEGPWRSGRGPRYWKAFDPGTPEEEKVAQILDWLEAPLEARPRLVTSWFRGGDGPGHRHGPGAPEVREALLAQDRALGRLLRGLERRGALGNTTLLLVSDHGMASVERRVDLESALADAGLRARVWGGGGFVTVTSEREEEVERIVAEARALGLEAHPRRRAPESWRVGHRRFGEVVVLAPPGVSITSRRLFALEGVHGHRPDAPGMGALFLAVGRGARPGARLAPQSVLDVAPTVLALLEVPVPGWMEGRPIEALVPGAAAEAP